MYYTVYKTINMINNKEYVGFHAIKSLENIKYEKSENGSIFNDGYLGSGVLMKKALEKYGPLNMRQELILATNDKKEAEDLEREIVCREWVESDNTYNISIGGNVCILFGKNNGFFGKKHTKETLDKIQESRKKAYENQRWSWSKSYLVSNENVIFYTRKDISSHFNIDSDIELDRQFQINKLVYDGVIRFDSSYLQEHAIKKYLQRYEFLNDTEAREEAKIRAAELCRQRFLGKPKPEEQREKISLALKSWIKNNPDEHSKRMLKINKNPEKIRKTVEKHRGMKRSEDAKRKMSEAKKGRPANNKSLIWIHNPETLERKYIKKDDSVPQGWKRGLGKRK